jgi:hypothetical protein
MTNALTITKTLIGEADDVAAAHEHFTTHYVVGGRLSLYGLLGQMLELVNKFETAIDRDDLMSKVKYRLRSELGIKTQKNTSDIAALIRYMTRADRKTAHVYTRVIEAAKAQGITPSHLPAFIDGAGGIERIRALSANSNAQTDEPESDAAERLWLTQEYLKFRAEAPLASFQPPQLFGECKSEGVNYEYVVCVRRDDGRLDVLAPLPATAEFEALAIDQLSGLICKDLTQARNGIERMREYAKTCTSKAESQEVPYTLVDQSATNETSEGEIV